MSRKVLSEQQVHPAVLDQFGGDSNFAATVDEVIAAVSSNDVVVVGMRSNPYPKKARNLLESEGLAHHYLEYGNYFKEWKRRGALKMWSGWQTFPMIFVKGSLVGGFKDLKSLQESGELKRLLAG